jgi:catechol 2,3-dioxygenase-like lactoylglutathione lyase family enzyme
MTEARRLQVQGIDHVLVVSSDLDKTRQFYCELLGMELMPRPHFSFPGLWFQAGKTQVHVTLAGSAAGTPGPGEFTGKYPAQGSHIAFEIEDAADAAAHIESLGIPLSLARTCVRMAPSNSTSTTLTTISSSSSAADRREAQARIPLITSECLTPVSLRSSPP